MSGKSTRDKGKVRVITFLDMVLALVMAGFYLVVAVGFKPIVFTVSNGPFSKPALIVISLFLWGSVFAITYLQLASAYRLFYGTFQDSSDLGQVVAVALSWLRVSIFLLLFIGVKILFSYMSFDKVTVIFWILTGFELFFRALATYFVREFADDLKHHIRITNCSTNTNTGSIRSQVNNYSNIEIPPPELNHFKGPK